MLAGLLAITLGATGCDINIGDLLDDLEELELTINQAVTVVQQEDPRTATLPGGAVARGDTIIINNNVTVINDVSDDLVLVEVPDITLVGFENLTGFDIYLTYFADGELQGILVLDGETLLLDYPCLDLIELLSEEDFDPVTGLFEGEYDLTGTDFVNPVDFDCGFAIIITIDEFSVGATSEMIDLVP